MKITNIIPLKEDFSINSLFKFKKTPGNLLIALITIVLIAMYLFGFTDYLVHKDAAYNLTRQHRWGLLIATYIFFVGVSTGISIIASLGHVFGIKEFNVIGKRATLIAIVTLFAGFSAILLDIGHPITMMIYNMLSPGMTSSIWWMGTFYSLVIVFALGEFIFMLRNDHKWSYRFAVAALLADIAAYSTLGSVFGNLVSRPIANGPFYPLYFILTAFVVGAFFLFLVYAYKYKMNFPKEIETFLVKMAQLLGFVLAIVMFFLFWRIETSIYGRMPGRADVMIHVIKGINFQLEVLFALIIPFCIILFSKGKAIKPLVYASFVGMISIFMVRVDMVHNAQLKPLQMLETRVYQLAPHWIHYFPSSAEILISVGAFGLCLLMYYLGTKLFNVEEVEH